MFRKTALSIAMFATLASAESLALGLGSIELKSALNQPLNAEVELLSATNAEMSEMKVEVGSKEAFRNAGIDRPLFLSKFKFNVKRNDAGSAIIHITSRDVVREPFLDFLLEVSWSKGRLLREYTVLVDPPVTIPIAAPVPQAPVVRAATPAVTTTSSTPVVNKRTVSTSIAAKKVRHTGLPPLSKTSGQYGPTQRADTLWKVAERVRPDSDVSIDQTMLGLLRANPRAFQQNNINNLKAGYVLRVPSREEFTSITKEQASTEARIQYNEWKQGNYPNRVAVASTPSTAVQAKPSVTLVSADESKATSIGSGKDIGINAINRDLLIASEALATQRRQSEEMSNRLSTLEEQIQSMQRLIQLKDDELARLQQNVSVPNDALAETTVVAEQTSATSGPEMSAVPFADDVAGASNESAQSEAAPEAGVGEEAESTGFMAFLSANPLWIGISGVILAMLTFFGIQRRNDDEELTEKELEEIELKKAVSKATLLPVGSVGMNVEHEEKPSDPLAEADVYLAYGRFQQAEDLLKAGLAKSPNDEHLNMKLLEVFLASKHQTAFDEHALLIKDQLENYASDPVWGRVAELGREISPDNALYSADQVGESVETFEPLNLGNLDEVPSVEDQVEPVDEIADAVSDEPVSQDTAAEDADDPGLDFDLGDFAFGAEESEAIGDGELGDLDEISTKLDLARAYIDMGDPEGAKSILDEVLEDGNDDQKNEANDILGQMA